VAQHAHGVALALRVGDDLRPEALLAELCEGEACAWYLEVWRRTFFEARVDASAEGAAQLRADDPQRPIVASDIV